MGIRMVQKPSQSKSGKPEKEGLGRSGIKERNILDPKSFLY